MGEEQEQVILYDLPSKDKGCACWSLNPWKTRLALNYKRIPYKTTWLEYPDVAPTLEALGIPPQEGEIRPYTIPAVRLPDGTHVMNSRPIAAELERLFPAPDYPSLHLDDPVLQRVYKANGAAAYNLFPEMLPPIPRDILPERSAKYFWETREDMFGMHLDELEKQRGGDKAWEAARPGFAKAGDLLRETEGPYFLGNTVSYADFVFVGFLHFLRRTVGEEKFRRVGEWEPELMVLYKACEEWLERDSY